jgi:signal transduction histidine kinase
MVARTAAWDHRAIAHSTDPGPGSTGRAGPDAEPAGSAARPPGPSRPDPCEPPEWPWGHHRRGLRHGHRRRGPLHRSQRARVLGGVCGGIAEATGIDVTLVRIGFVLLSLGSGIGVLVYAVAWLLLPLDGETGSIFSRAAGDRRGLRIVVAVVPALVVLQLAAGALHASYVGSFSWPIFLAAAGGVLIWRNASDQERTRINDDLAPMLRADGGRRSRWPLVARVVAGVAVGVVGVCVLVLGHTSRAAFRPLAGAVLVIAAIVVVFGPWWLRIVRDLIAERQARALAEERAQMAAHVHDSVLQTLALIQRSADDPHDVVRLARAQERELRSWLFDGRPPGTLSSDATTVAEGVDLLQRHVEADHGITVQVVVVGDGALTDGLRALLDAAREATVNAAKWSGASQVSLYAEIEPDTVTLFVRDRGRGFDPDAVPDDRQGIAQSIRARVARYGGTATIRSSPGNGTEVGLSMPRRGAGK